MERTLFMERKRNIDLAAYEETFYTVTSKPSVKEKNNTYFNRYYWPKIISHEIMWFLSQYVLSYTADTIINDGNDHIFKSKGSCIFVTFKP